MIHRNDDPPHDPGQEQAEALAELLVQTLAGCKGIDIEDSSVDDAVLAIMNICAEHYRNGQTDAMAAAALALELDKDSPQ